MSIEGRFIVCDCCRSEKLAEIIGDNLVIRDRRHGRNHIAIIPLKKILDKMADGGYAFINKDTAAAAAGLKTE